jgi:UDP-N-acetylmuramyl tripeptide synthase
VIGGHVALRVDPGLARQLAASRRIALVTGTNGKTTTTTLLAAGMASAGPVATNRTGANLANGLTGALLARPDAPDAALEVDEAYLPWALGELRPAAVALLNLSRDQLDRLNEVRGTAERWRAALSGTYRPALVVANADDPLVVFAADPDREATWVGAGLAWQLDASACPWCEADLRFDADGWRCESCGRARPDLAYELVEDEIVRADGQRFELALAMPGRSARANAAIAFAVLDRLGVPIEPIAAAWSDIAEIEGRFQHVVYHGAELVLHLAKNPAGWSDLLALVAGDDDRLVLVLNAQGQDGRDPSWIWDVPFEQLRGRRAVCIGERGLDLAVRLEYAGLDVQRATGLADAARRAGPGRVELIANYSAFQQVRAELGRPAGPRQGRPAGPRQGRPAGPRQGRPAGPRQGRPAGPRQGRSA